MQENVEERVRSQSDALEAVAALLARHSNLLESVHTGSALAKRQIHNKLK